MHNQLISNFQSNVIKILSGSKSFPIGKHIVSLMTPLSGVDLERWLAHEDRSLNDQFPILETLAGKGKGKLIINNNKINQHVITYIEQLDERFYDIDLQSVINGASIATTKLDTLAINIQKDTHATIECAIAKQLVIREVLQQRQKHLQTFGHYPQIIDRLKFEIEHAPNTELKASRMLALLYIQSQITSSLSWYQEVYQPSIGTIVGYDLDLLENTLGSISYRFYNKNKMERSAITCLLDAAEYGHPQAIQDVFLMLNNQTLNVEDTSQDQLERLFEKAVFLMETDEMVSHHMTHYFFKIYSEAVADESHPWNFAFLDTELLYQIAAVAKEKDPKRACEIYDKLNEEGEDVRMDQASFLVESNDPTLVAKGMTLYHTLADDENIPEAQYVLALQYQGSEFVEASTEKTLEYFRKATVNHNYVATLDFINFLFSDIGESAHKEIIALIIDSIKRTPSIQHPKITRVGIKVAINLLKSKSYANAYGLFDFFKDHQVCAYYFLGIMHYNGLGREADPGFALIFWKIASEGQVKFKPKYKEIYEQLLMGSKALGSSISLMEGGGPSDAHVSTSQKRGFSTMQEVSGLFQMSPMDQGITTADSLFNYGDLPSLRQAWHIYKQYAEQNPYAAQRAQMIRSFGVFDTPKGGVKIG